MVTGAGSAIHLGDPNVHHGRSSLSVNTKFVTNLGTISTKERGLDSIESAASIDVAIEKLFDILRLDCIDDPAEWVELLVGISCGLVSRVAEQPFNLEDDEKFNLPTAHLSAMRFLGRLQEQIKATDAKLYASFKWVAKKNGLSSYIATTLSR